LWLFASLPLLADISVYFGGFVLELDLVGFRRSFLGDLHWSAKLEL